MESEFTAMEKHAMEHDTMAKNGRPGSVAEAVRAALQLARLLRYRRNHVIATVVVCCLVGALYCTTATRFYAAKASLWVIPGGSDVLNPTTGSERSRQAMIPTYERLFFEDRVLNRAVELLKERSQAKVDFRGVDPEKWPDVLRRNLGVKRVRRTNLIGIAYQSKSPKAAEETVAAIVQSYLDFMDKNHRDVSTDLVKVLEQERSEIERRLVRKQQELLGVKRRTGELGLSESSQSLQPAVQRVLSLNETLVDTQRQRLDIQATLVSLEKAIKNRSDLRQHLLAIEPMVGRELLMGLLGLGQQSAEIIGQAEQRLIQDRARVEKLLKHYGPVHPEALEAQRVVEQTQKYVAQYHQNAKERLDRMTDVRLGPLLVSMLQERLVKTRAYEDELSRQLAISESEAFQLTDRMAEATIAENEVQRLRQLHDTLLNRIAGIDINENQSEVRVTVVSDPVASDRPVAPRLAFVSLICLVGGFALGICIVYVLDLLDDRFQSPDEIEQQIDAPLMAMVRTLPESGQSGLESVLAFTSPETIESEAFRTLRTALQFSQRDVECLAITSTEPGDGKTTLLACLGVTLAQAGQRTLLIDADLRKPGLSRLLGARGAVGLSQVLRRDAVGVDALGSEVRRTGVEQLDILPSGARPSDPTELLSSPRFAEVLAWAGAEYDRVLVDCPPVLAASDAAIVARQADGVILVVRPEKNPRQTVLRVVARLKMIGAELIGIVVNRVGQDGGAAYFDSNYTYEYGYGYGADENSSPTRRAA